MLNPEAVIPLLRTMFLPEVAIADLVAGVDDDDCAVIEIGGTTLVVTTDLLNAAPIALELGIGTYRDLGRICAGANLSDLCGSGSRPVALLLGACLPRGAQESDMLDLAAGFREEAAAHGVAVIGGDTKLGGSRAVYGVAIGTAPSSDCLFLRSRGIPGDDIWVSGALGSCAAAVLGLRSGVMSADWVTWAKAAVLRPRLPLAASSALSGLRIAHAGTDVSDGLAQDLGSLCRSSGCGAMVEAELIPADSHTVTLADHIGIPAFRFALTIGGDLQFIVTVPPKHRTTVAGLGFIRIGVLQQGAALVLREGALLEDLALTGHSDSRGITFAEEVEALLRR